MSKRSFVLVMVFALAVVLTAGGLLASNMGFKVNAQFNGVGQNGAVSNENHFALPFNPQLGLTDATTLLTDVQVTCSAALVQRFNPTTGFRESWAGGKVGGTNFSVGGCESYFTQMNAAATCSYIMVGSHDPNLMCTFNGTGVGGAVSNENNYALPYHTTASNASDLLGQLSNTQLVQRFNPTTGFRESWAGGKVGGTNFTTVPGEGYFVQMNAAATQTLTPDHY